MNLKHSKQREAVKAYLMTRTDHPSADMVYLALKDEYPNISLGTVYRNLTLLADLGEIQRLHVEGGTDRFDANTRNHYHFICKNCGCVQDVHMPLDESLSSRANQYFNGQIDGYLTYFYGKCSDCSQKSDEEYFS